MSDLDALAADLVTAAETVDPRKLVQVEATNVKNDWREAWSDITGMPHIDRAVTYDTHDRAWGAEAEIGPDLGHSQGPLGGVVETGGSERGPIRPVIDRLADEAQERLEKYLLDVAGRVL